MILYINEKQSPKHLHLNVGVGESVDIHGCQVSAALHSHTETPAATAFTSLWISVLRRGGQKLQGKKKTPPLLQTVQLLIFPLWTRINSVRSVRFTDFSKIGFIQFFLWRNPPTQIGCFSPLSMNTTTKPSLLRPKNMSAFIKTQI